jgi:hypothetical protein
MTMSDKKTQSRPRPPQSLALDLYFVDVVTDIGLDQVSLTSFCVVCGQSGWIGVK